MLTSVQTVVAGSAAGEGGRRQTLRRGPSRCESQRRCCPRLNGYLLQMFPQAFVGIFRKALLTLEVLSSI